MQNTQTRLRQLHLEAFTVLESLLTLAVIAFLTLSLSSGVKKTFSQTEETLFLLSFEALYKDSQQLAIATRQPLEIHFDKEWISSQFQELKVPEKVSIAGPDKLRFDPDGGNSSLAKVSFSFGEKRVDYQLYLGSGRYKKTSH